MNVIALVSYPFLPARSGGQKGIALFYKYFSRYHTVTVVSTRKNKPDDAEPYELINLLPDSSSRYFNPAVFFMLRKLIRDKKASHLILEHPYYAWLGILLKKFYGVRLVVHSHNIEGKRWKSLGKWWWRILWGYEKQAHRQADYNFFIQDADRTYAIQNFGLDEKKCITVSFGTEISGPPGREKHFACKSALCRQWQLPEQTTLMFFNGAFQYAPNREALENLIFRINPLLQTKFTNYIILIAGLDIPYAMQHEIYPNIRVLGFVEDLELYLTGCDVFLNPVRSGGGIKTKLVEALAYNLNAVSTETGAIGIDPALCAGKLRISPDHNWALFADAIVRATELHSDMPEIFYKTFYWDSIARRAAEFISVDPRSEIRTDGK